MKALRLTTAADEEPALSNRSDETPASSGLVEKIDELAGRMGGMNMALNFLAHQSESPNVLYAFGYLFLERFKGTGKDVDIDNAISAYELAIGMMSTDHEEYGAYTGEAGVAWLKRFEAFGNIHDIDRAIALLEISLSFTPESDANLMGQLDNLGISLQSRFERTGDLADIENAISNKQRAVELSPPGDADLPGRLNGLGYSLQFRFERTGDLADIENAISNLQRALEFTLISQQSWELTPASLWRDWRPCRYRKRNIQPTTCRRAHSIWPC